jgi:hypothetical protein
MSSRARLSMVSHTRGTRQASPLPPAEYCTEFPSYGPKADVDVTGLGRRTPLHARLGGAFWTAFGSLDGMTFQTGKSSYAYHGVGSDRTPCLHAETCHRIWCLTHVSSVDNWQAGRGSSTHGIIILYGPCEPDGYDTDCEHQVR